MTITPLTITESLARQLIQEQFSAWAHLPINAVENGGVDNRTFHLGHDMSIRMPSAERYVRQVLKEHQWLPLLAPHLPLPIPQPLAMGEPSKDYPWHWSVYKWLEGTSANSIDLEEENLEVIALQLAQFLAELHKFDAAGAPTPGLHNWWRAAHTSVYDAETRSLITKLALLIDSEKATSLWERAIRSKWEQEHVWVHGDVASGNMLVKDNKLSAIIDFGCMGIGDPACDLTIAWTFFKNKSRQAFRNGFRLDSETWARARGWALWKALYELSEQTDKTNPKSLEQLRIIEDVLGEHSMEGR
ncbi:MAG: aminoglycoside phosphotransferase family protein [Alphaproteobacteria bacterium]|nr:aminoglycoside phosphotransferase family protein [Alphaproteobacteria bacterium]